MLLLFNGYWQPFKERSPVVPARVEGPLLPEPSPLRTTRTPERTLLPGNRATAHQESTSCTNPSLPTCVPIRHLMSILTFKYSFYK